MYTPISQGVGALNYTEWHFMSVATPHMLNYGTLQSPNYPIQIKESAAPAGGGAIGDVGAGGGRYKFWYGPGF